MHILRIIGVPDSSKLQIQKQITTNIRIWTNYLSVFPIIQSYKFKSKSQHGIVFGAPVAWCSR